MRLLGHITVPPRLVEAASAVEEVDPAALPATPELLSPQRVRLQEKRDEAVGLDQAVEDPSARPLDPPAASADPRPVSV